MKKIGIMGGTFNPIHVGHIEIADAAYKQYQLDQVWFMPNHIPAYKSDKGIVSAKDRLNMTSLAIENYDYFIISDYEIKREGKTYSYETFSMLTIQYPDTLFYFIMGADSLFYFEKWVHPEIIVANAHILCASRDDNGYKELTDRIKYLEELYPEGKFDIIKCNNTSCSSSELRNYLHLLHDNINDKEALSYVTKYIPKKVFDYIMKQGLY